MRQSSIAAILASSLPLTTFAQTPTYCNDTFDSVNATINVTVAGLYPQSTGSPVYAYAYYDVTTAVKQFINEAANTV